jgi:ATP-dependent DNA helicase RecG
VQPKKINEILDNLKLNDRKYLRSAILKPLLKLKYLQMVYPNKPTTPKQQYFTTKKGLKKL